MCVCLNVCDYNISDRDAIKILSKHKRKLNYNQVLQGQTPTLLDCYIRMKKQSSIPNLGSDEEEENENDEDLQNTDEEVLPMSHEEIREVVEARADSIAESLTSTYSRTRSIRKPKDELKKLPKKGGNVGKYRAVDVLKFTKLMNKIPLHHRMFYEHNRSEGKIRCTLCLTYVRSDFIRQHDNGSFHNGRRLKSSLNGPTQVQPGCNTIIEKLHEKKVLSEAISAPWQAFRMDLVSVFLKAKIPLKKIDDLRFFLEKYIKEYGTVPNANHLADYIPPILDQEKQKIRNAIVAGTEVC